MNHTSSVFFAVAALLSACGTMNSAKLDNRDFAVDTYYPASNEIRLAENRARQYWQKNSGRFGAVQPRYLAVEASSLLAAELSAEFSIKLDRSKTSGAYFTQGISSSSKQGLSGVLIYDTQTDRSVGPQGYIIVALPRVAGSSGFQITRPGILAPGAEPRILTRDRFYFEPELKRTRGGMYPTLPDPEGASPVGTDGLPSCSKLNLQNSRPNLNPPSTR